MIKEKDIKDWESKLTKEEKRQISETPLSNKDLKTLKKFKFNFRLFEIFKIYKKLRYVTCRKCLIELRKTVNKKKITKEEMLNDLNSSLCKKCKTFL